MSRRRAALGPLLAAAVALAGAAVAQPPDADRPAIRGGYGIELGSQLNAEELRRRGFRQDERYAPRWSKSHEGGELTVILPEMPDRANERISSISYSRAMTAEGNRDSNSICTARRTSELRRLMAAHPTLERREHNEESAESVTTRDYLVPRGSPPGRARARSITVECYTPRGDFAVRQGTAGRSTLFILFLDKQLSDAADAARAARPRSIPIDTSPGSSGAGLARTLEQFIRAQQELGWEELARRAAANYSYDWATVLIDNSVNDCERALAADRARLGACADLRLRSAGYARRAGRLIEAETDVRRAIQHFEALTPADPAGLGNAQILLADLLTDQGRYAEATAQARRALAGLSEGRLQLQNANAHAALARALWRRGEIDEAETQALRAVALLAPNGNTPVDRAWDHVRAASMLGGILADQGRWPEADAAHRGAVNLVHTAILFGGREGWPVAADAYAAYGEFELGRGRPAEAERIFRHALAVTRLTVGSLFTRSRATADAYHRLGLSLVAQGKHEEAEIQFRHAVGIRQFDEAESAEYAPHRIALANAWLARGSNPREAYGLYDQAVRAVLARALTGNSTAEHEESRLLETNRSAFLGQVQAAWAAAHIPIPAAAAPSTTAGAVALYRNLLTGYCRNWSAYWEDRQQSECMGSALAAARGLLASGDADGAIAAARQAVAVGEVLPLGPDGQVPSETSANGDDFFTLRFRSFHYPRLEALSMLAAGLEAKASLTEAEALRRQALAGRLAAHGETHAASAGALLALGLNLNEQRRAADAEPLLRRAVAAYLDLYGDLNAGTAAALDGLAASLGQQGRQAEARPLTERASGIRARLPQTAPE